LEHVAREKTLEIDMKLFNQGISIKSRDHFYDDIKINRGEIIIR